MPKEIFNEGRVVGMSAYEIYLRHQLSEYPEMEPVTEREWLSSTVGAGCSMILKIPANTPAGTFNKQLPDNSTLCAATNITATVFDGQVALDASGSWATKVISYGPLISNTSSSHPATPGDTVPVGTAWTEAQRAHLKEYMKIIDGLVFQPGTWKTNPDGSKQPFMDLAEPNLHKRGTVRLSISKQLDRDVYVMLTGWVHRPIVAGSTKIEEGCLNLIHPWNGDFLGAERFPWATKITFVVPTEVMHILNDKAYIRELVTGQTAKSVVAKPTVDYDSVNLQTFYNSTNATTYPTTINKSRIPVNVTELNVTGDGAAVIGAYQRADLTAQGESGKTYSGTSYPPILYGVKATTKGASYMVPIDTGAPGTVKIFDSKESAVAYPKVIPNTYSLWHDKDNSSIYLVEGDNIISLDTKLETLNLGTGDFPKYASIVKSGDSEVKAISLLNDGGAELSTTGEADVILIDETRKRTNPQNHRLEEDRYLRWDDLLHGLGTNKRFDLIGANLSTFRKNLPNVVSGPGGVLKILGSGQSEIDGKLLVKDNLTTNADLQVDSSAKVAKGITVGNDGSTGDGYNAKTSDSVFKFNKPIRTGAKYIEFDQGNNQVLRLYICSSKPSTTNVPVGSIGIGWS